ncbi:hypothetical protein K3495_g5612 [Podosphaera aphanis]|nr:hypothetical protein K3495_g5612 [Podosphaera aphanis]
MVGGKDAIIHSQECKLELRKSRRVLHSVKRWRQVLRKIARPRIINLKAMTMMMKEVPACKASLADIIKALRLKLRVSLEEARCHLPAWVRDFAYLFADDSGADDLPPHRGSLDLAINLPQEDGKPVTPPWGPLYNMSREKLLVL